MRLFSSGSGPLGPSGGSARGGGAAPPHQAEFPSPPPPRAAPPRARGPRRRSGPPGAAARPAGGGGCAPRRGWAVSRPRQRRLFLFGVILVLQEPQRHKDVGRRRGTGTERETAQAVL